MTESKFFVSIIVALYNQKDIFDYMFHSLLKQKTDVPYEIIFADDGSDLENTIYYIKKIKEAQTAVDIDIKFVQQQDRGFRLAASRNNALNIAKGNIIINIDGDVIIDEYLIRDHLKSYTSDKPILVYTDRQFKDFEEIGIEGNSRNQENLIKEKNEKILKEKLLPWQRAWGFNISFSRPLDKKDELLYDENFVGWGFEDGEFVYRLSVCKGYSIVHNSISSIHINPKIVANNPYRTLDPKDLLSFINKALYFIEKYNYDKEIIDAILPRISIYDSETDKVTRNKIAEKGLSTEDLLNNVISMKKSLEVKYG